MSRTVWESFNLINSLRITIHVLTHINLHTYTLTMCVCVRPYIYLMKGLTFMLWRSLKAMGCFVSAGRIFFAMKFLKTLEI